MQILYGPKFNIKEPTTVTIGKFDGLHQGHIKVINKLLEVAKKHGLSSVVYTFDINPRLVLKYEDFTPIMTNKEKSGEIERFGVDYLIYEKFDMDFANMTPEEFVVEVLLKKINAKIVIMGENSAFGKDKTGNPDLMKNFGVKYGFNVEIVDLMIENGEVISSSRIRETNS